MKMNTTTAEALMEISPGRMESAPSDGPTVRSSRSTTGAGRAPARSTMARSRASSTVKWPVMTARPLGTRSLRRGAENQLPWGRAAEEAGAGRGELSGPLPVAERVRISLHLGARQLGAGEQRPLLDYVGH